MCHQDCQKVHVSKIERAKVSAGGNGYHSMEVNGAVPLCTRRGSGHLYKLNIYISINYISISIYRNIYTYIDIDIDTHTPIYICEPI